MVQLGAEFTTRHRIGLAPRSRPLGGTVADGIIEGTLDGLRRVKAHAERGVA